MLCKFTFLIWGNLYWNVQLSLNLSQLQFGIFTLCFDWIQVILGSSSPESSPADNVSPRHCLHPSCLPLSSCPLLLSSPSLPPASSQLCILAPHLAHPWGKSLPKAANSCHTDPSSDVARLYWEVWLILCLSSCIGKILLQASCLCHCCHQLVDSVGGLSKPAKCDSNQWECAESLTDWSVVGVVILLVSCRGSILVFLNIYKGIFEGDGWQWCWPLTNEGEGQRFGSEAKAPAGVLCLSDPSPGFTKNHYLLSHLH